MLRLTRRLDVTVSFSSGQKQACYISPPERTPQTMQQDNIFFVYRAESTFRRRRALWGANGVEVKGQRRTWSCGHKALWGTKSIVHTEHFKRRDVYTAHFELCKSFYQIKTNWTHYIISLFEKINIFFLLLVNNIFICRRFSLFKKILFYHSEDFYRRYSRSFCTQTFLYRLNLQFLLFYWKLYSRKYDEKLK